MPLVSWQDEYRIGIYEIDEQHIVLFNYINQLADALNQNQFNAAHLIFETLVSYTQLHFITEVRYFSILKADDKLLHELQHKHIIEQLNLLLEQSKTIGLTRDIFYDLIEWFVIHIQCEDKKLSQ